MVRQAHHERLNLTALGGYPVTYVLPMMTFLNHVETLRTGQNAPSGWGNSLRLHAGHGTGVFPERSRRET